MRPRVTFGVAKRNSDGRINPDVTTKRRNIWVRIVSDEAINEHLIYATIRSVNQKGELTQRLKGVGKCRPECSLALTSGINSGRQLMFLALLVHKLCRHWN